MKRVDVLLINLTSANGKFVHPTYLDHVEEILKEMRVDQLEVLWVHNAEITQEYRRYEKIPAGVLKRNVVDTAIIADWHIYDSENARHQLCTTPDLLLLLTDIHQTQ